MSNYKAIVAKIDRVVPIDGADRIQTAYVLGEQVVVPKELPVGHVGIFFPADTQLSEDFCKNNNLFRKSELNKDADKKGFFDTNRKVRCQPFMKVRSEGYFCELESLSYLVSDLSKLKVGDNFDSWEGASICNKFISEKTRKAMNNVKKKKTKVVDTPMFNKHVDTDQFKYSIGKIKEGDLLSFHAKVHGTSARYSYSKVLRKPSTLLEKVKNYLGLYNKVNWEYLVGTRNVVLYSDQYDKEGFHGPEQYRFNVLESLKPYLEKGMTIYGEIAGFANGKPIMGVHSTDTLKDKKFNKKYSKNMTYTYGCKEHECRFHVYRITIINEDGVELDMTNQQVNKWCEDRGILSPLEVHPPYIYDGDKEKLEGIVEDLTERLDLLTEDYIDPSHVSEGIIVRVDNEKITPTFLKSKSYAFKVMEGIFKEDNIDEEDAS